MSEDFEVEDFTVEDFTVEIVELGNAAVVKVGGEIDLATAALLGRAVRRVAAHSDRVELDFSDVTFLDSSGIRILVESAHVCKALRIVNAHENVERIIRLVGIQELVGLSASGGGSTGTIFR